MSESIKEQAAKVLGMKAREITDVDDRGHYAVITTHDGVRTVVDGDGNVVPYTPEFVAALDDRVAAALGQQDEELGGDPAGGDVDEVPAGTVDVVLEWVGQDAGRAQRALDAEQAAERPRTGLVDRLQKVVSA